MSTQSTEATVPLKQTVTALAGRSAAPLLLTILVPVLIGTLSPFGWDPLSGAADEAPSARSEVQTSDGQTKPQQPPQQPPQEKRQSQLIGQDRPQAHGSSRKPSGTPSHTPGAGAGKASAKAVTLNPARAQDSGLPANP